MAEYNPSKIIKDGNTYNFRDDSKIPLAGSNKISGDLIPSTDGTVNLGSPSYQWNQAYIKSLTINGVACGDILTHNASEFVDVSTAQIIAGNKTFMSLVSKSSNLERGTVPTTNINEDPVFISGDKNNRRTLAFFNYYNTNGNGKVILYAYNQNTTNFDNIGLVFDFDNVNNNKSIYPVITNACNLGTSINKWKSFNGINPGALSLPSSNSYTNVDTTDWDLDGTTNAFTPTSDGWLGIRGADTVYDQTHYIFIGRLTGGEAYYQQNVLSPVNALWNNRYYGCVLIPVIKNKNYHIRCICSNIIATFYPCQGNV